MKLIGQTVNESKYTMYSTQRYLMQLFSHTNLR